MLANWDEKCKHFVKVFPHDLKRVLGERDAAAKEEAACKKWLTCVDYGSTMSTFLVLLLLWLETGPIFSKMVSTTRPGLETTCKII